MKKKPAKKVAKKKVKHHYKAVKKAAAGIKPLTKEELDRLKECAPGGKYDYFKNLHLGGGRPKKFETPEILMAAANEYFQYILDNPWFKNEYKDHSIKKIPIGRPFSMSGLAVRLGVSEDYFSAFVNTHLSKTDPLREGFLRVIESIKHIIRTQKYEGAMVGAYNANLVAYEMGYKKDHVEPSSVGITINIADKKDTSLLDEVTRKLKELED